MQQKLKKIGRIESIDLPEWDFYNIDAKIDTGAYTSSLHCHHITSFTKKDGNYVRFNLLDPIHDSYEDKLLEWPVHRIKSVKSSNGLTEERYIVQTKIILLEDSFDAEFSLADRSEMRNPILIGRRLLKNRFLVDVSQKYLSKKNVPNSGQHS